MKTRMNRLFTFCFALAIAAGLLAAAEADPGADLLAAARKGEAGAVEAALKAGATLDYKDSFGKTALHCAAEGGHMGLTEWLLKHGANPNLTDSAGRTPLDYAVQHDHDGTAGLLVGVTKHTAKTVQVLNPELKYPDQASFEKAIGIPACLLKSEHVWLFAPARDEADAKIVLKYLVRAYDLLHRLTGVNTEYIIVVYNFPQGNKEAFGGTGNCVIYYDDANLQLSEQEEWRLHHVPHVSGYIEEMAHNFVSATKTQFGWEMVGWTIGTITSNQVANNPIFLKKITSTRQEQAETYQRYRRLGCKYPDDLPPNQVDRIHAYLLWQCERRYGGRFWPDFFKAIAVQKPALDATVRIKGDDAIRNERYRITVDTFDGLPGLQFKKMLLENGISPTVDVKSLHPTEAGWNRKLQ